MAPLTETETPVVFTDEEERSLPMVYHTHERHFLVESRSDDKASDGVTGLLEHQDFDSFEVFEDRQCSQESFDSSSKGHETSHSLLESRSDDREAYGATDGELLDRQSYDSFSICEDPQFSQESFDSSSKGLSSEGMESSLNEEMVSMYSEEGSVMLSRSTYSEDQPQESTPTTVIVLQHLIERPEVDGTQEEVGAEEIRAVRSEPKSLSRFRRNFGTSNKSMKESKSSKPKRRSFVPVFMKKSKDPAYDESTKATHRDSREDTEEYMDEDLETSADSRCQPKGEWSQQANPAQSMTSSRAEDFSDIQTSATARSTKSNKSSRSSRSLNLFKRRRSRDARSIKSGKGNDSKSVRSQHHEDIKSVQSRGGGSVKSTKSTRSWFRLRRKRSQNKESPPAKVQKAFSFRDPRTWGRRNRAAVTQDPEPEPHAQPSHWEMFLEGCDNMCCSPLFPEEEGSIFPEEEGANQGDNQSEAPSEIFVDPEASKNLYTI